MDGMEGNGAETDIDTDTRSGESAQREILLRNTKKQANIENPRQIERESRLANCEMRNM